MIESIYTTQHGPERRAARGSHGTVSVPELHSCAELIRGIALTTARCSTDPPADHGATPDQLDIP
eukprot:11220057-Lingulodinium_polyedra.AAC.1